MLVIDTHFEEFVGPGIVGKQFLGVLLTACDLEDREALDARLDSVAARLVAGKAESGLPDLLKAILPKYRNLAPMLNVLPLLPDSSVQSRL